MSFIHNLRLHLQDFETEVSDEIHRFIDFLEERSGDPKPAVVAPPQPAVVPAPATTFVAPVTDTAPVAAPVEEPAAATPAPAETAPAETAPTITAGTTTCTPAQPTTSGS